MDDLISRRKAFEYFVTLWECIGTIMDRDEWEDVCMTTANEIPSAQPERKTGRWLQISPAKIYECSECAQMVMTDDISCYKYCHGCGAYMGGGEGV